MIETTVPPRSPRPLGLQVGQVNVFRGVRIPRKHPIDAAIADSARPLRIDQKSTPEATSVWKAKRRVAATVYHSRSDNCESRLAGSSARLSTVLRQTISSAGVYRRAHIRDKHPEINLRRAIDQAASKFNATNAQHQWAMADTIAQRNFLGNAKMTDQQLLTRELIERGGIDAIIARDAPAMHILSDLERMISLQATLARRPQGAAWLFGYGSLIWNPTVRFVEQKTARIKEWHRSFCVSTPAGRGSIENPGLVLGLDTGGECTGVAFRIEENKLEAELTLLWRREMLSGAYVPTWVELFDDNGRMFGHAIAFTIDKCGCQYAGGLTQREVVNRIATASGALGSAADYLFRTCEGLRANEISDPQLEALASAVEAAQSAPDLTHNDASSLSRRERHSGAATRIYRSAGAE